LQAGPPIGERCPPRMAWASSSDSWSSRASHPASPFRSSPDMLAEIVAKSFYMSCSVLVMILATCAWSSRLSCRAIRQSIDSPSGRAQLATCTAATHIHHISGYWYGITIPPAAISRNRGVFGRSFSSISAWTAGWL